MMTTRPALPPIDNPFEFEWPDIYARLVEPLFDWNRFRRTHLQFQLGESLHDSHVYDRCNCAMVKSSWESETCPVHAAHRYLQRKTGESMTDLGSCPCVFCRKHFSEKDRPPGLLSPNDLKRLFPARCMLSTNPSPPTMAYLSRPFSAPVYQATFPLDHTFALRYVPTFKRTSRPLGVIEEIFDVQPTIISKSAIPTQLGMRLDAEPDHDHSLLLNIPRERNATFRSLEDYFNMTPGTGPTMTL